MKKIKLMSLLALACVATGAMAQQKTYNVTVSNPLNEERLSQPVVIKLNEADDVQSAIVMADGKEIPCQIDDLDRNGAYDELCFLANLDKKQSRTYTITTYNTGEPRKYEAGTFAQLLLRNPKVKESNKQNNYVTEVSAQQNCYDPFHMIHSHGVMFENEMLAMRIYFDQRQTVDLYGKRNKGLELERTQFYPSKEQKEAGLGDDVLWVGDTYGLGTLRLWSNGAPQMLTDVINRVQRIICAGPIRTIVEVEDRGLKIDERRPRVNMTERFTLYAGQRYCDVDVTFSRNMKGVNFGTGIINVKGSKGYTDKKGIRGCWGTDWPSNHHETCKPETVGLGIYIPKQYIQSEEPVNNDNYGYVLQAPGRELHYKIAYTSLNETFGFGTQKNWFNYLKKWREEIENPVKVTIQ